MALSKQKKSEVVEEAVKLLSDSKLTVLALYSGISVKAMQELRSKAAQDETEIRVIKNRLVKKAIEKVEGWNSLNTDSISGQLLYAFNAKDEVSPAKNLAEFAKDNPTLEFVGAISHDGNFISSDDVKALANLPSKEQLLAQLVGTIAAPLSGFVSVMSGPLRNVVNVLNARSQAIS